MPRARRRQARQQTEDAQWQREREDCLRYWPGDDLAECVRFWEREPGVPDDLRCKLTRYRILPVTDDADPEYIAALRAEWEDLKARRMKWLRANGYR